MGCPTNFSFSLSPHTPDPFSLSHFFSPFYFCSLLPLAFPALLSCLCWAPRWWGSRSWPCLAISVLLFSLRSACLPQSQFCFPIPSVCVSLGGLGVSVSLFLPCCLLLCPTFLPHLSLPPSCISSRLYHPLPGPPSFLSLRPLSLRLLPVSVASSVSPFLPATLSLPVSLGLSLFLS